MTYTAAGDLATLQEPTGATYTLTWDECRRLTRIRNNDGETIAFERDNLGNPTDREIRAADGTTLMFKATNAFDEIGRLIRQVGGENRTWRFGWDKKKPSSPGCPITRSGACAASIRPTTSRSGRTPISNTGRRRCTSRRTAAARRSSSAITASAMG